jgi:hypothetical protein
MSAKKVRAKFLITIRIKWIDRIMNVTLHRALLNQHIFKYLPEATRFVADKRPADLLLQSHLAGRSPFAHAAVLSAIFCHLRINPPEKLVEDFEGEFATCLREREILNILEVGPGQLPFWDYLQPLFPQAHFFGLGLNLLNRRHALKGIAYHTGDLLTGVGTIFDRNFDLVISIGTHCSGGMQNKGELNLRDSVIRGNQSALDLTSSLSINPYAAFFASSFWGAYSKQNILFFERTALEETAEVLFWADTNEEVEPNPAYTILSISFNMKFETKPTDFVILAKKIKL